MSFGALEITLVKKIINIKKTHCVVGFTFVFG